MTGEPERAALRQAITDRDAAKEAVRVASESSERSMQLLRTARSKLAAFGDVDDEILRHRAKSYKTAAQGGPRPSLALPEELVRRERARDEAASAVAAAQAARASLASELATAESALRKAELKVSEKAGEVLVTEAAEPGGNLTDLWNHLWATVDALNALRSSLHVKLPSEITRTLLFFEGFDYRQFAGSYNAQLANAAKHWKAYHGALCKNADAAPPEANFGDGVSSAAIECVA